MLDVDWSCKGDADLFCKNHLECEGCLDSSQFRWRAIVRSVANDPSGDAYGNGVSGDCRLDQGPCPDDRPVADLCSIEYDYAISQPYIVTEEDTRAGPEALLLDEYAELVLMIIGIERAVWRYLDVTSNPNRPSVCGEVALWLEPAALTNAYLTPITSFENTILINVHIKFRFYGAPVFGLEHDRSIANEIMFTEVGAPVREDCTWRHVTASSEFG